MLFLFLAVVVSCNNKSSKLCYTEFKIADWGGEEIVYRDKKLSGLEKKIMIHYLKDTKKNYYLDQDSTLFIECGCTDKKQKECLFGLYDSYIQAYQKDTINGILKIE